jgi:hypothetical protein
MIDFLTINNTGCVITRVLTIKGRNKTLYNKEYPHLSVIVLDVWIVIIGGFRYDE